MEPFIVYWFLEIISWFLIELDEDDEIIESENWISRIEELGNSGDVNVKIKVREVLKDADIPSSLNKISFFERIKGMFK